MTATAFSLRPVRLVARSSTTTIRAPRRARVLSWIAALVATNGLAHAQCPEWSSGFGFPGTLGRVLAMAAFDDGSGPALFVGGTFGGAESQSFSNIAKWNGVAWSDVGGGINGTVAALAVFDDGTGPALYAGGDFDVAGSTSASRIAKWNGTSWSALGAGTNNVVHVLAVSDVSGTPALYAGGEFTTAGGSGANRIARWNGTSWSALGSGMPSMDDAVFALATFDDGSGNALYAGGSFVTAGGVTAVKIAKWDGAAWYRIQVGNHVNGNVYALAVYDDGLGGGPVLYAGGGFTLAGGSPAPLIAKWNGSAWSALPSGVNDDVRALCVHDDGSGAKLMIAGDLRFAPYVSRVVAWNGVQYSALATGVGTNSATGTRAEALAVFDDGLGGGAKLFCGGAIDRAGKKICANIAVWDGTDWDKLGGERGLSAYANELLATDAGPEPGPRLYASTSISQYVMRLDSDEWSIVGSTTSGAHVYALTVFDDGSGPALYAGGPFPTIDGVSVHGFAKWNGTTWSGPSSGIGATGSIFDMVTSNVGFGGPSAIYAVGSFTTAGGVSASKVAKWDGSAWSSLGSGLVGPGLVIVWSVAAFDDGLGGGTAIYATGNFTTAGGGASSRIAKWDGGLWSPLSTGLNAEGHAMAVFDDGGGPALFVGGTFTTAGGAPANYIAKWDGTSWSALGSGMNAAVYALTTYDDGSSPALYASGAFGIAGGAAANHLAKWDGSSWSALPGVVTSNGGPLAVLHDGTESGPELYVGGDVTTSRGIVSRGFARLEGCGAPGVSYCFGDDLDPLVTADCPCGNFGEPYHGCGNFPFTNGAVMTASGTKSPNTILFTCSDLPNNTLCTFLRGANSVAAGFVFGDGVRCVQTPLLRFGQQNSGVGGNPPSTAITATPSEAPGVTRYYQCQYRNPVGGWCDPGLFNVSNGYVLQW